MTINQQVFYKTYGVRNVNELAKPRLFELAQFEFPMRSVLHYATYDSIESGPPGDYALFNKIAKPIYFKAVTEITAFNGSPRLQNINVLDLLKDYRNSNRRMKMLQGEISSVIDPNTLVVLDYCILNKHYRYARNLFTDYHRWKNIFTTVVDTLVSSLSSPQTHHYLPLSIPELIPSLNQLDQAALNINQATLKVFKDNNSFVLLELWKWLDPKTTNDSLFSKIPVNKLHLVDFVYIKRNKWCTVNLGVINSFRMVNYDNLSPENTPVLISRVKLEFKQIQKRILSMFMTLEAGSIITVDTPEDLKLTRNETQEQAQSQVDLYTADDDEEQSQTQAPAPVTSTATDDEKIPTDAELAAKQEKANQLLTIEDDDDEDVVSEKIRLQDMELDQQIDQLNEINERKEKALQEQENATIYDVLNEKEPELDKVIEGLCDKLADNNMLTAGEYKRFMRLAGSYKTIIAKDGKSTLEQYVKIPPEDLVVEDKVNIPDSDAIVDKTMLRSSLESFTSDYVKKDIIGKDSASMVMAIQRAGLIVTDYKVETYESILGAEEEHTVRIVPVEGVPSTIRFKVPVINSDGTFKSAGVLYRSRMQIGDNPIRKIDFNRVALTSYYGKTFVNRSRKRANDYGVWLQNAVMAKGLDKTDTDITDIFTANVFDNTLSAPRAYSGLSMSFKSFKAKDYMMIFDHKVIADTVDKSILAQYEKDGSVICGYKGSEYLVMDKNNAIYRIKKDGLEFISSVEDFFNIEARTAPVEYAEVVIGAKDIPIGVVLSYYIGFSKLLKLLNLNPVRVEAGKRVSLQPNEYSLVFSDETLVFSRDDRLASLIIGGFLEYHKTIRAFNVHSFDKRGVYVNLLESNKLGSRYIREMDLMQQMFIDPITKEILQEMKEPTTFNGLLVRACELLLDDKHPEELDTKYMRIKGYERIPGAIYRQLVGAIRQHNAQLGKASKQVVMNPYAVWKHITEDPTKVQVNEINPIQALKESENVTFSGTGGRNSRSMVKSTRAYHRSSMGTISESTKDSSDVGIDIYTSANPQFKSLRGLSRPFDFKEQGATSLLSTSAMLAPASDKDD